MVADVFEAVGIDHVVTMDLHAPQIEGFFHLPVDSLTAVPTLCNILHEKLLPEIVVVAPDAGALRLATDYAHRLKGTVAVLHKRRESGTGTQVTHLVRPDLTIVATHGLLLPGAREKLAREAVKNVFITDTVAGAPKDWPRLQVISIAPVIAGALKRLLEHQSLGDLY
jgi:ribose-phosphate pyrophosphokinase